jgi:NADH:ubiquinone oxidoreductase subunit 5 (subunit L)/multisubunit Na+/H+ antiporter MnhA subunit
MSDDEQQSDRSALEAQADQVRAKLATTLERLDRKRHEIVHLADVPAQIEEHVVPIAAGAALVLVATGALVTYSVIRLATASQRRPRERMQALRRAWYQPEYVGQKKVSFLGDLLRKLAMGAATTVAMRLVKKAMDNPQLMAALPPQLQMLAGPSRPRRKRPRAAVVSGSGFVVDDGDTVSGVEPVGSLALTDIARTGDAG